MGGSSSGKTATRVSSGMSCASRRPPRRPHTRAILDPSTRPEGALPLLHPYRCHIRCGASVGDVGFQDQRRTAASRGRIEEGQMSHGTPRRKGALRPREISPSARRGGRALAIRSSKSSAFGPRIGTATYLNISMEYVRVSIPYPNLSERHERVHCAELGQTTSSSSGSHELRMLSTWPSTWCTRSTSSTTRT